MPRVPTAAALALATAFGGAAMAQQTSGAAGASGDVSASTGEPASEGTEVKGACATKRMMGISTGQTAGADADVSGADERSAGAKPDGDTASE